MRDDGGMDPEQEPGGRLEPSDEHEEPHAANHSDRLNALRAGVLGANDGIVSTAGVVIGVAAAGAHRPEIFTAGLAALVAGAVSMALGEYVSVSSQRDSERAMLAKEEWELRTYPEEELAELAEIYRGKGLSEATAQLVAEELTAHDALAAHVEVELGLNPDSLVNPWTAAFSSAVSFTLGAIVPLLAILLPPPGWQIPVTFGVVLLTLAGAGAISARVGQSYIRHAVWRMLIGGAAGLLFTFGVGALFGHAVG
jgi:VIT1/CCC1 family predicted Fe2+/Mn2+ transporter